MGFSFFKKRKKYETDIWAIGIARAAPADFFGETPPRVEDIRWIEADKSYQFLADPHGIWREDKLYIFAEALDYRVKKGVIDCFILDKDLNLLERKRVMEHKSHLSYPFIVEDQGDIYMIPEASRTGECHIYRATDFPTEWKKLAPILPDTPMIDASFIQHDGLWWVFYALPQGKKSAPNRAFRELHIAYSENLLGPWTPHKNNPVSDDASLSRSGGRPFIHEGKIHLPVQDCSKTYGGQINIMRIDALTPEHYSAKKIADVTPTFNAKYSDGLHTFSACGSITLIDCKYIETSPNRRMINLQRKLGRVLPFIRRL